MAREDLASALATQLSASTIQPVFLVKLEFDSGDVRLWTGYGDLTFNSEVYSGGGNLIGMSQIDESTRLQAGQVALTLSGVDASIISLAETEDYQERPGTIWIGAIDDSGALVVDPYPIYGGRMDVMTMQDDGGEATITVTIEHRFIDFERSINRVYTDQDHKAIYSTDKFFEFMSDIRDKRVRWGFGQP